MKIERVYIADYEAGWRLTQCCVASIRRWYPDIPISLVKDELCGPYDTRNLEEYWDVDTFPTVRKQFGRGLSKFEPLSQARRERCLILDDDIVFLGRVIDRLERFDEDFVCAEYGGSPENLTEHYFDLDLLAELDPDFRFTGETFNTGQFVATTGILTRDELATYMSSTEPPQLLRPDIFKASEQGLLNYLLLKKRQTGEISLRLEPFMWWSEWLKEGRVKPEELGDDPPKAVLLHWAGPKPPTLERMRHPNILRYFEDLFYSRLPSGAADRDRRERLASHTTERKLRLRERVLSMVRRG